MQPHFTQGIWTLNDNTIKANSTTIAIIPTWSAPQSELDANSALLLNAPSLWLSLFNIYHFPHLHINFPNTANSILDTLNKSSLLNIPPLEFNFILNDNSNLLDTAKSLWNALFWITNLQTFHIPEFFSLDIKNLLHFSSFIFNLGGKHNA